MAVASPREEDAERGADQEARDDADEAEGEGLPEHRGLEHCPQRTEGLERSYQQNRVMNKKRQRLPEQKPEDDDQKFAKIFHSIPGAGKGAYMSSKCQEAGQGIHAPPTPLF